MLTDSGKLIQWRVLTKPCPRGLDHNRVSHRSAAPLSRHDRFVYFLMRDLAEAERVGGSPPERGPSPGVRPLKPEVSFRTIARRAALRLTHDCSVDVNAAHVLPTPDADAHLL